MSEIGSLVSTPRSTNVAMFSPGMTYNFPQNQEMPSPTLSISSIIRPQSSTFTGQSPAPIHRSLSPDAIINALHISPVPTQSYYRYPEEEQLRTDLARVEASFGSGHVETSDILYKLGGILLDQGRYKSAEEIVRKLIEGCRKVHGDEGLATLNAWNLLGVVLRSQGHFSKAAATMPMKTIEEYN